MLERSHVEKLLKLNGVEPTAPDEEIKSVLISARWHKNDVETALLVLRENTQSHESHVDSLHKVFRSDDQLKPETISALLGVDVSVTREALARNKRGYKPQLSIGQMIQIGLVSFSASVICLLASMWYLKMGVFHATLL
jgi:hypothetical protein